MLDFLYYNDTGRHVKINDQTDKQIDFHGKVVPDGKMKRFKCPEGLTPIFKMIDAGGRNGLELLIMLVDVGSYINNV